MTEKTTRKPNWTEREELILIEAIRVREDRLFGKMRGVGGTKNSKIKELAWEEVAAVVNANSYTTQRSVEEVKKKYSNIKHKAKEKSDPLRRSVTAGGGPFPPSPPPVKLELLSDTEASSTPSGLSSRPDTEEVILGTVPEMQNQPAIETCIPSTSAPGLSPVDDIEINRSTTDIVNPQLPTSTSPQNASKRRKTVEEDEILTLRAEREKYIQEAEFYRVKTLYVKLKIQQMKTKTDSEF
ncbi:uncharacterized protein LOC111115135 isoform X2 [Crassostrea virginica]